MAQDFDDAKSRLQAIAMGRVDGIYITTVPAEVGVLIRFLTWLLNLGRSY